MNLVDLQALYEYADGPVLTACLDVSRDSEAGQHELRLRWQGLREQLEDPAAGPQLDLAEQRLLAPTHLGGAVARTVVVRGVEVALDRVLPGPALPLVHRGPFPRLSGFLTAATGRSTTSW